MPLAMQKIKKKKEETGEVVFSREPKYTVKDISEMLGLSKHAIRYYDNENLLPYVSRSESNIRLFSDYDIQWLKTVNCLRYSGLPIIQIKEYIKMCIQGDETIADRAKIIFQQEKILEDKAKEIKTQLEIIRKKKAYYEKLLTEKGIDTCNPVNEIKNDSLLNGCLA
ncbi:MAG TPA: MerR family transcriptional regulator [Candidatus Wallbacteria bacterium]|nr:MerR family transcriptional regulator [Candidatus Wallbacteria bacterium]